MIDLYYAPTGNGLRAAVALAAFGALGIGAAQAQAPIKIGVLHPVTGALSYSGTQSRAGALMAIEEINARGSISTARQSALRCRDNAVETQAQIVLKHDADHAQCRAPQSIRIFRACRLFINRPEACERVEFVCQSNRQRHRVRRHIV